MTIADRKMLKMYQMMFEQNLRVEKVIHLGSQLLTESLPSMVEDAFSQDGDEIAAALGLAAVHKIIGQT